MKQPIIGQLVETKIAGEWCPVVVCSVPDKDDVEYPQRFFVVRRPSGRPVGKRSPAMRRNPSELRPSTLEVQKVNIYADWLEENGEPSAAKKLRDEFPL